MNTSRGALGTVGLVVTIAGCGLGRNQGPVHPATTEEAFKDVAGVNCSAVRPKTEPDLMAWDPESRMNLSRLRKQGVVVVRYQSEGCHAELELLPNCIARGKYQYEPYSSNDSKLLKSKQDLFAELPLGAVRLAGKFGRDQALRTDTMLVGMAALPPARVVLASDLEGPGCEQASHVISRVYLGGFGLASGDQRTLAAELTVFGAGAGAAEDTAALRRMHEGNPERCREAQRTGQEDPLCSVPLRVGLTPIEGGGRSVCPRGSSWNGRQCVATGRRDAKAPAYAEASECLRGGNAFFVEGNARAFDYPGRELLRNAKVAARGDRDRVQLRAQRSGALFENTWDVEFSTTGLGEPLEVREYLGTSGVLDGSERTAGLSVSGHHRTCGRSSGRFKVLAVEWSGKNLERFAAAFSLKCAGDEEVLRGCVYYDAGR